MPLSLPAHRRNPRYGAGSIGLLNSDEEKKKDNSMLDLVVGAGVLKIYEQMAAMGTTSAVGFFGDGAGGAVGISLSVTA